MEPSRGTRLWQSVGLGTSAHPDWYHNLVANPDVTVEVGTDRFDARARVTKGEERDRLYAAQAALMPGFAEYQRKTARQIPVVMLERSQVFSGNV